MSGAGELVATIRTAVPADLPELQRIFRSASLSNSADAPLLLARPEFLQFAGEGVFAGRTRVAVAGLGGVETILGFATVTAGDVGEPELDDLFVDPRWQRRGVARRLIEDAVADRARVRAPALVGYRQPPRVCLLRGCWVRRQRTGRHRARPGPAPSPGLSADVTHRDSAHAARIARPPIRPVTTARRAGADAL